MRLKTEGKSPARIAGLRPEILFAMIIAEGVCRARGIELVITSVTESEHSPGSLHYVGLAFDMRVTDLPLEWREDVRRELSDRLGAEYDVVLKPDPPHIHFEFQPKKGMNL